LKKLALLFPGQGSQHIGMGKDLCQYFPVANKTFEEASDILNLDMKKLCFDGDKKELTKTENAQPALLTLSVAKYRVYQQELGITPFLAAGHSLGEFSALTCSNAVSFPDALKMVRMRGQLMQEVSKEGTGGMSAISGLNKDTIENVCCQVSGPSQVVVIANYNSPDQIVISGHKNALDKAEKRLSAKGAKVFPLNVSAPFHSPLLEESAEKFAVELAKYTFKMPDWPVISNYNALPYKDETCIPLFLKKQITHPIQWQLTMEYMKNQGIDVALEIGPKKVLNNLMKKNCEHINVYSTNTREDLQELYEIDPEDFIDKRPTLLERCLAMAVCTPNRNFNEEAFENGVIQPYQKIKNMYYQLIDEKKEADAYQMKEAVILLQKIFDTKKVPVYHQRKRFKNLFKETGTEHLFLDFKI
jgi:[acyl-carrier-protein] S-malonyltransferase